MKTDLYTNEAVRRSRTLNSLPIEWCLASIINLHISGCSTHLPGWAKTNTSCRSNVAGNCWAHKNSPITESLIWISLPYLPTYLHKTWSNGVSFSFYRHIKFGWNQTGVPQGIRSALPGWSHQPCSLKKPGEKIIMLKKKAIIKTTMWVGVPKWLHRAFHLTGCISKSETSTREARITIFKHPKGLKGGLLENIVKAEGRIETISLPLMGNNCLWTLLNHLY